MPNPGIQQQRVQVPYTRQELEAQIRQDFSDAQIKQFKGGRKFDYVYNQATEREGNVAWEKDHPGENVRKPLFYKIGKHFQLKKLKNNQEELLGVRTSRKSMEALEKYFNEKERKEEPLSIPELEHQYTLVTASKVDFIKAIYKNQENIPVDVSRLVKAGSICENDRNQSSLINAIGEIKKIDADLNVFGDFKELMKAEGQLTIQLENQWNLVYMLVRHALLKLAYDEITNNIQDNFDGIDLRKLGELRRQILVGNRVIPKAKALYDNSLRKDENQRSEIKDNLVVGNRESDIMSDIINYEGIYDGYPNYSDNVQDNRNSYNEADFIEEDPEGYYNEINTQSKSVNNSFEPEKPTTENNPMEEQHHGNLDVVQEKKYNNSIQSKYKNVNYEEKVDVESNKNYAANTDVVYEETGEFTDAQVAMYMNEDLNLQTHDDADKKINQIAQGHGSSFTYILNYMGNILLELNQFGLANEELEKCRQNFNLDYLNIPHPQLSKMIIELYKNDPNCFGQVFKYIMAHAYTRRDLILTRPDLARILVKYAYANLFFIKVNHLCQLNDYDAMLDSVVLDLTSLNENLENFKNENKIPTENEIYGDDFLRIAYKDADSWADYKRKEAKKRQNFHALNL